MSAKCDSLAAMTKIIISCHLTQGAAVARAYDLRREAIRKSQRGSSGWARLDYIAGPRGKRFALRRWCVYERGH